MAKLFDFLPREQYDLKRLQDRAASEDAKQLTPRELYQQLFEMSLEELDSLIRRYKTLGTWNPHAERLMRRVFDDINAICSTISGASNAPSAQAKGSAGNTGSVFSVPVRNFVSTSGGTRSPNRQRNRRDDTDGGGNDTGH